MFFHGYETIGLLIGIVICCVLLVLLHRMQRMSEPARQGASGANPGKPPRKRAPSQRVQAERNDQVIALAKRGLGPDEIARKLGMTGGEVALVLNLDRSRDDTA